MEFDDLRRRLFGALATSLAAGCGPTVASPDGESDSRSDESDDDDAQISGAEGNATTSTSLTGAASTTGASESDGGIVDDGIVDDGNPKFDVLLPDAPPIVCPEQPAPPLQTCGAELPDYQHYRFYCVEELDCESWAAEFDEANGEVAGEWECLDVADCSAEILREIGCGPLPEYGDQCCFWFVAEWTQTCPGRPFVVDGRERLADPTARADWAKGSLDGDAPPSAIRRGLADVWTQHALFEHASIASFSRFILHLLACGAPADLVAAANVALGEEIEHAQLFFGFASHYAGAPVGPGALDVQDSLSSSSFADIVLFAVREGCIAETISAWHVALAAKHAGDPVMAQALERVAAQELDHALLAWRFLEWAWARADEELRARIVETFRHAEAAAPRGATASAALDDETLLAHGLLPASLHASATRHALRELVVPAARRFSRARGRERQREDECRADAG